MVNNRQSFSDNLNVREDIFCEHLRQMTAPFALSTEIGNCLISSLHKKQVDKCQPNPKYSDK